MTLRTTWLTALAAVPAALAATLYFNRLPDFAVRIDAADVDAQLYERNDEE